jgi:NADPH-dependent glutamate synthase beta subunit-like oxidoreductase
MCCGCRIVSIAPYFLLLSIFFLARVCISLLYHLLLTVPFPRSARAQKPKSLIVIGGGYIACELAFYFGGLGVPLTVVVRSSLLRNEDGETAAEFARVFTKRFRTLQQTKIVRPFSPLSSSLRFPCSLSSAIAFLKQAPYARNSRFGEQLAVRYDEATGFSIDVQTADGKQTLEAQHCLVATGVVPNTDQLDVEKAGIKVREGGFIAVNEFLQTSAENVWALGDIAGALSFSLFLIPVSVVSYGLELCDVTYGVSRDCTPAEDAELYLLLLSATVDDNLPTL